MWLFCTICVVAVWCSVTKNLSGYTRLVGAMYLFIEMLNGIGML